MEIVPLADVPEAIAVLAPAFKQHWSPDKPDAHVERIESSFRACLNRDRLPLALVARRGADILGTVALLTSSVHSRPELGPWLGALYVFPAHRRRGVGAALIAAAEDQTDRLQLPALYAGTESAVSLFLRQGWLPMDSVEESGEKLTIFRRP